MLTDEQIQDIYKIKEKLLQDWGGSEAEEMEMGRIQGKGVEEARIGCSIGSFLWSLAGKNGWS